jgi:hypothetical protein
MILTRKKRIYLKNEHFYGNYWFYPAIVFCILILLQMHQSTMGQQNVQ